MFENVGGGEILLILIVVLVFFGPKKIPELAASLGKGIRKFNEAKEGIESQVKTAMKEPLEAITGVKTGLESSLREAAEPLHAQLNIPASKVQPVAPAMPLPPETLARGTAIEPPAATIEATAAATEASAAATEASAAATEANAAESVASNDPAPHVKAPEPLARPSSEIPKREA